MASKKQSRIDNQRQRLPLRRLDVELKVNSYKESRYILLVLTSIVMYIK